MGRILALALIVCGFAFGTTAAEARGWQCVTYARSISDFDIRGNANTWWGQAAGRFERGNTPAAGSVLAFKSIPGMRAGHVAIVKEVVSAREVVLDHANWTIRGGVERDARAIDVSEAGDWSAVRVSYGRGMGTRINPTFGFIYARESVPSDRIQFASAARPAFRISDDIRSLAESESGR